MPKERFILVHMERQKRLKGFFENFCRSLYRKKIFRSFQPYSKVNDMVEKFLKYGEYD